MSEHRDDHAAPLAEPRDNASVVPSASSFSPSPLSNDTPVNAMSSSTGARSRGNTTSTTISFTSSAPTTPSLLNPASTAPSSPASPMSSGHTTGTAWGRQNRPRASTTAAIGSSSLVQTCERRAPDTFQTPEPGVLSHSRTDYFDQSNGSRPPSQPASTPGSRNASTHNLSPPLSPLNPLTASSRTRSRLNLFRPSSFRRSENGSEDHLQGFSSSSLFSSARNGNTGGPRSPTTSGLSNPSSPGLSESSSINQSREPNRTSRLFGKLRPRNARKNSSPTGSRPSSPGLRLPRHGSSPALYNSHAMPGSLAGLGISDLASQHSQNSLGHPVDPGDLFDLRLPRELRLRVFRTVATLAEEEEAKRADHRPAAGPRELLRISVVCKTWQSIALDGAFWNEINVQAFGSIPRPAGRGSVLRIASHAGSFIRTLRLSGCTHLTSTDLANLTCSLSDRWGVTMLSGLALDGCRRITTGSLNDLLSKSPALRKVKLSGLDCVAHSSLIALFRNSLKLHHLDVSFCHKLKGSALIRPAFRHVSESLVHLSAAALSDLPDEVVSALFQVFPRLTTLDIRFNPSVTDKALLCSHLQTNITAPSVLVHLALSGCDITDEGLRSLSGHTPSLEEIELANLSSELRDPGVEAFLSSVPHLKKLDLSGNVHISDRVLRRLCPSGVDAENVGQLLEQLIISKCSSISNEGISRLLRSRPRLSIVEADNTRIEQPTVQSFVHQQRQIGVQRSEIVVTDCRAFSRNMMPTLAKAVRPRRGDPGQQYRELRYVSNDGEMDEFDESRIVLKSWAAWAWLQHRQQVAQEATTSNVDESRSSFRRFVGDSGSCIVT